MMFFKIKTAYPEYKPLFSFLLVRDFIAGSESHKQKKSSQDLHFSFFFQMVLDAKDNKCTTDLCLFLSSQLSYK